MTEGITISAPLDLRAFLAKMKSAKAQGVNLNVWDSEIKAVEDAVATIEAIRALGQGARCPTCYRTDKGYKLGRERGHHGLCRDPWHADDHLRVNRTP